MEEAEANDKTYQFVLAHIDELADKLSRRIPADAAPLQRLKDWGFLTIEGDELKLNREALLEVDRLLHEFFLPQHLTNRTT